MRYTIKMSIHGMSTEDQMMWFENVKGKRVRWVCGDGKKLSPVVPYRMDFDGELVTFCEKDNNHVLYVSSGFGDKDDIFRWELVYDIEDFMKELEIL